MGAFSPTKTTSTKLDPAKVIGGIMGGFDEIGFEIEAPSAASVVKGVGSVVGEIFSLVSEVAGVEQKPANQTQKFSSGSIEFNQPQAEQEQKLEKKAAAARVFYQALKDEQQRAQIAKDKLLFEEEINDITLNLPADQKNELLHFHANYRNNKSVYHRAELRKQLIEQRKISDTQQKEESIAETKPKASAMQTAFEGGSGSQGSGQSNLSFQATG